MDCRFSLAQSILKTWIDFVFPPICKICKEPCATRLFCPECWELCASPDPANRCRHCFEEMEEEICKRCRNRASLPFPTASVFEPTPPVFHLCTMREENPEALAAFAIVQWERLEWPVPDIVVPMPGAKKIGAAFADMLGRSCVDILRNWRGEWEGKTSLLEEEALILLLSIENSQEDIGKAIEAISEAFPKKVFVLSFTP